MRVSRMTSTMRLALAAGVTGLAFAGAVPAEELPKPPSTPKLADAVERGWLRAGIVSGRIVLNGNRMVNLNDRLEPGGSGERLSIRNAGDGLRVDYELPTAEEQVVIQVTGESQFLARRSPKGDSSLDPVEFRQPAEGPLWLTVGPKEQSRTCQAASLWHLFLVEPETCREHLAPLLGVLNHEWDLSKTAREVETALVRAAVEAEAPDPRRWAALVEQLGDPRFSRREAADRELRALGRVLLTYLEQLDPSRLDAEQHYRVRRILMTLAAGTENDTPSQIAAWLAGDPVTWWAMLSRDDESTRRLAAERLQSLLGEPILFDPAADATARAAQIEALRSRLTNR